jgi:hypothetical protein
MLEPLAAMALTRAGASGAPAPAAAAAAAAGEGGVGVARVLTRMRFLCYQVGAGTHPRTESDTHRLRCETPVCIGC